MEITPCFVRFEIASLEALNRLGRVVDAIRSDKNAGVFRDENEWLVFFNEQELERFWWPTDEELQEWTARWFATPVPQRFTDHSLRNPWCFLSMLESIENAEYEVLGVRQEDASNALLEFEPGAFPYGGMSALRALVQAYGHTLVGYDDGTGYCASDEV